MANAWFVAPPTYINVDGRAAVAQGVVGRHLGAVRAAHRKAVVQLRGDRRGAHRDSGARETDAIGRQGAGASRSNHKVLRDTKLV